MSGERNLPDGVRLSISFPVSFVSISSFSDSRISFFTFSTATITSERSISSSSLSFSSHASTSPTFGISPSLKNNLVITPSSGLGTSVSTLSVATSITDWSSSTRAPSSTSHFVMVASITPSPIAGRTISILAININFYLVLIIAKLNIKFKNTS